MLLLENIRRENKTYFNRRASLPDPQTSTSDPRHDTSSAHRNCRQHIQTQGQSDDSCLQRQWHADCRPVNHNESVFYCVPAAAYEALMELIDDAELLKLVKERANGPAVRVTLDEL